jgi:hypothetical protein
MRSRSFSPHRYSLKIATLRPSELLEAVAQRREAVLRLGIILGCRHEHANAPHPLELLRPRRERPCRRAAEKRDDLAPSRMSRKEHCEG